ncbi:MAG: (2Fe-2S)-binding protein [Syntrophobacterales bacterium]|jgi:aerobic-type carbon monoxide dehydrogenase small subunit (CoxS/CutS family)
MPEKERETKGQISRRQFLKSAGIVVGGTAVGSSILISACSGGGSEVITKTATVTKTATDTVNVTTSVAKFVCPYDSQEFDTFAALQSHVEAQHSAGSPVTKYVCPYDNQEFDTLAALKAHLDAQHVEVVTSGAEGIITMKVNGKDYTVKVEPDMVLSYVLREKCLLPGTKTGCWRGECGTCTVLMDGRTVYSCLVLAVEADGSEITTVEGLAVNGELSPLQQSFVKNRGFQCGFCTPGYLISGTDLLAKNPSPTMDEVKEAVSGHLCACGNMNFNLKSILEGGS